MPGDPALRDHRSIALRRESPTTFADVPTTALPCDNNGADTTPARAEVLTRAEDRLSTGIPHSRYFRPNGTAVHTCVYSCVCTWGQNGDSPVIR